MERKKLVDLKIKNWSKNISPTYPVYRIILLLKNEYIIQIIDRVDDNINNCLNECRIFDLKCEGIINEKENWKNFQEKITK